MYEVAHVLRWWDAKRAKRSTKWRRDRRLTRKNTVSDDDDRPDDISRPTRSFSVSDSPLPSPLSNPLPNAVTSSLLNEQLRHSNALSRSRWKPRCGLHLAAWNRRLGVLRTAVLRPMKPSLATRVMPMRFGHPDRSSPLVLDRTHVLSHSWHPMSPACQVPQPSRFENSARTHTSSPSNCTPAPLRTSARAESKLSRKPDRFVELTLLWDDGAFSDPSNADFQVQSSSQLWDSR
ncbi:hypothetical protein BDV93DRAFT_515959 [Ceratobasidium sp. AG-I]|nr:hypothetical protein BDV93DRAFT_515959 [Ceratobasidium sp. AG-I]